MGINLLNIEYEHKYWLWLTILSIEYKGRDRSLLHIEYDYKANVWKFQLLWLNSMCWIIKN